MSVTNLLGLGAAVCITPGGRTVDSMRWNLILVENGGFCLHNPHSKPRYAPRRIIAIAFRVKQELSYRQQIARQLRTQYAEGIYKHKYYTVTLKSRLMVTQDHWKRNHWIDITWLTIVVELFDVEYYRDLEMWVRGHSRSLKMVPLESLGAVSYLASIITMALSCIVCEI